MRICSLWFSVHLLSALLLVGVSCRPANAEVVFLLGDAVPGSNLFTYDTDSGVTSFVGWTGATETFGGLAYNPRNDLLYMVSGRNSNLGTDSNLYSMNPNTGAATLIGSLGHRDLVGLAYDIQNDVLYASQGPNFGNGLYSINMSSGQATFVGSSSVSLSGLSYDSQNDRLVGVRNGGVGFGAYYSIDRSTAATTLLGTIPFDIDNSGLTYDPTQNLFWGFDRSPRSIYTFDPDTGNTEYKGQTPLNSAIDGAAFRTSFNAVPEPSSIYMFAVVSLLLLRRKRTA